MIDSGLTSRRLAVLCLVLLILVAIGCGGTSTPSTPPAQSENGVPAIASITPSTITAGAGDLSISVAGTGFVSGSAVRWKGTAIVTTFSTDTSLKATVPASDLADGVAAPITVFNPAPGGGSSAAANFTVSNPLPVLTAVSPASVVAGSGQQTLTLAGTGFVPSTVVNWNGTPLTTSWIGRTELKATLPASAIAGSSASAVTVHNRAPGGGASSATPFDVTSPTPVLTSVSPKIVPAGQAATITLTGTGFEMNSIVQWNGSPRPTVFVSATVLRVALSAADLKNAGTGSLTVDNPGPNSTTSGSAPLVTTDQAFPTITDVSVSSVNSSFGPCAQLLITVTGKNFNSSSTIQINGMALQPINYLGDTSSIINYLPAGLVAKPGALSVTVTNPWSPPLVSAPFIYPATSPTVLAVCAIPSPTTVYPKSNFTVIVQPTEVNATGSEQLSVGSLPNGLSVSKSTIPLPATGAVLHFQAAESLAAGSYNVALHGTAGSVTTSGNLALTVATGAVPNFFLISPLSRELAVPIGASASIQFSTNINSSSSVDFDITPSVSGLPSGTTASFSPAVFSPGQSVTVTITAAANAPVTQNAAVTLTGTPSAPVTPATTTFLVDVTQPPGSLPNNRTDFTSTGGSPYGAVYDGAHNLIFASNPAWNRVDVLSNKTHELVKSIPIPNPCGLDITQDQTHVWVTTQSQQVYEVDTTRLAAIRYLLPPYQNSSWEGNQIEALADGTLLLGFSHMTNDGSFYSAVWNPSNNTLTNLPLPSNSQPGLGFGPWKRSGDGSKSYSFNSDSMYCQVLEYDVSSKSVRSVATLNEVCGFYAVNQDGSRLVAANNAGVGMYDGSFNLLGIIFPGGNGYFAGSFLFSRNGSTLYELSQGRITTIDTASFSVRGAAPASSAGGQFWYSNPSPSLPFDIDSNGMMLDIQSFGIGFEDATFFQNYGGNSIPTPSAVTLSSYSGPLSGGTQTSPYGYFALTPDVWFGDMRGTATLDGSNSLILTSPPSTTAGPVNLKYLFPDGAQLFSPRVFTYSAFPEYAILSGGSPDGGEPGTISGYGLPTDPSNGSLTVGGNSATITTKTSQYLPFTQEPFPSTYLNFTVPPGTPGFADIAVTTQAGTGTLPNAFYYAKSVKDYTSSDKFTSVLFDAKRNQVYLTAKDHVDVFSTTSNQYVSPLYPAAQGANKQFSGLALTPDDSQLLVTDLMDGSLAVINPDAPSSSFAITIAPVDYSTNNCAKGPLYVATTSDHRAFVTTGSLPAPSCPADGILYVADLQSKTAAQPPYLNNRCYLGNSPGSLTDAFSVAASRDGNYVAIGASALNPGCLYSVATNSYSGLNLAYGFGVALAGDANVVSGWNSLSDTSGHRIANIAQPLPIYPSIAGMQLAQPLYRSLLNASGSLYYIPYPNYFEIVDVLHARLLMRFSLNETIQATASPLAIDAGGRHVYLATDKGLTIVDLGAAPLAIGHLSQQTAGAGSQVTVRGSGFDSSVTATVGGEPASVSVTDENTLTLTVPAAAAGPEDVLLTRGDGSTYTMENGIIVP